MSAIDAQNFLSAVLRRGSGPVASAVPPAGHMTKIVNGKAQTVTAAEAWEHPSTIQTDVPTLKAFLGAVSVEFQAKGDPDRAKAAVLLATQF